MKIIKGAGHNPFYENVGEFVRSVLDFWLLGKDKGYFYQILIF